jgi:CrcB protein
VQVFDRSTPFAPNVLVAVAVGGAIGATARWFVAWAAESTGGDHQPGTWPWATLVVNVVGCVLIGFAARRVERDTTAWALVVTGVLGGFTTFSALAIELNDMADAERLPLAVLYGAVTLAAGVGATMIADLGRSRT